ncbi:hypothetical protein ACFQO1_05235 [Jejudonia soesokkakensis]|uniref:Uncharacterized protein n=1 Tax=Jejudonia soesokkakensis TaxID=1323432 RepID=A0ABW2MT73_9FLAO
MKTAFEELQEEFKKIKNELWEEEKLKFPSHHTLKQSADKIIDLLKNTKIEDEEFSIWSSWRRRYLDIFKADLVGELYHDYDKRNKRYRNKWLREKEKMTSLFSDFYIKFYSIKKV